ncbi:MAG: KpsF/GutQ family sugar-phosphate isomerase [Bacteroidetes bacterium]|nr:KpsF/GutQ family sugar-phosphate isomerase [Bacteroidota bacterium]
MHSNQEILNTGIQVIKNECDQIRVLADRLGNDFVEVVQQIFQCKGNIVVTGIGKSANIAQKIVATFNSTGTTAVFLHAADAIHGDLGIIREEDIIIILSKSGETPEIKVLLPLLRDRGNKMVAIVGNMDSFLAKMADFTLDVTIEKEACPNNLAPTTSTTAQLIMGDALAVALLEYRGFTAADFARFHPGGALGKQLYLRVGDLFQKNEKPVVSPSDDLRKVIIEISAKRLGATAVVEHNRLVGVITDGDLRRMLMNNISLVTVKAADIMTRNPKTIDHDSLVVDALGLMRLYNITQLPVMHEGVYAGVIHLHDILKEGII